VAAYAREVDFEAMFTTPHGVDCEPAARLCGASFPRARSVEELRLALKQSIGAPGLHLVEVPVEREADTAHRRALFAAVAEALA
jgi:2-succinyl-5-enolpyruvyl-6-hydroxy-3-cyclohexene-1-carboxylate synthase